MDFAFAPRATQYDRMMRAMYSYRQAATVVNATGINSIKHYFHHLATIVVRPLTSILIGTYGNKSAWMNAQLDPACDAVDTNNQTMAPSAFTRGYRVGAIFQKYYYKFYNTGFKSIIVIKRYLITPTSGSKMKSSISNLTLSIALFLNCYNHKTMSKNFCDCLVQNDWACIKKEVDKHLNTLNKNDQEDTIATDFKKWLLNNECIQEVDIQPGLIETDPPIKQFTLKITTPKGIIEKTIGIQISKTVLKAYIH